MNDYVQEYIDSVKSENTKKVLRHVLSRVDTDNIENCNLMQMEQRILDSAPNSPKAITTAVYVLSTYFKWLQEQSIIDNDSALQLVKSIDKKLLWQKVPKTAKKKFINNEQYEETIKSIATYEEYNALYFELLFSCIWNGIYNQDMSVIKNLRRSDIEDDGMVTLHEDNGHTYRIKIPERLAKDLIQLSTINEWIRPNRFSLCHVEMKGVYPDSVFKVESRSTNSGDSYKFSYYAKLRKIAKEHVGYSLLPLQLYASGIMHRIKLELKKNDITLEEAFSQNNRNRTAHMIIEKELVRCNSGIEVSNFRELVKGYINSF